FLWCDKVQRPALVFVAPTAPIADLAVKTPYLINAKPSGHESTSGSNASFYITHSAVVHMLADAIIGLYPPTVQGVPLTAMEQSNNRDTSMALAYHEATKHSYTSVRSGAQFLDWSNRPLPYKIYPGAGTLAMPRDLSLPPMSTLSAMRRRSDSS